METPLVALLIDWENIKYSCANHLNSLPDIITLKKIARKYGKIAIASAYANWMDVEHGGDMQRLFFQNVEPIYVETRTAQGTVKGSVDIRMACDSVELLFTNPAIHTYVLASGDGGFSHIAIKLKAYGKTVIPVGIRQATSSLLGAASDELLFYDDSIRGMWTESATKPVQAALSLFLDVVERVRRDNTGNTLQAVKLLMKNIDLDFEEENIGIPSFRHLAYLAEKENMVKIDSTSEPAAVYRFDEQTATNGTTLYEGKTWNHFINAMSRNTQYSYANLREVVASAIPGVDATTFIDDALHSLVLWKTKAQFGTRELKVARQDNLLLNTHHPRVQVYFSQKGGIS
ncbi:MAG: NYN domain-containing protein [Deltaproteobacteria bacterium]|nr:NYN domain-containing protein [Deltaproteobacteria bacterium]